MLRAILIFVFVCFAHTTHAFEPVDCEQASTDQACMACNIYHEARGESVPGQLLVAAVTANRVKDHRFPDSVCEVTWQRRWVDDFGYVAQFSWTWDGLSDKAKDGKAWMKALFMGDLVIEAMENRSYRISYPEFKCDPLWYHNFSVKPKWRKRFTVAGIVGNHIFYCDPNKLVLAD